MKGILQNLIQLFVEHHSEWRQLVSVVAGNTSCDIIFFSCTIVYSFSLPKVTNILIVLWYSLLIALYHLLCSGSLWFFFANAQESCLSFHQRSYDIIKKILRMFGTVFFYWISSCKVVRPFKLRDLLKTGYYFCIDQLITCQVYIVFPSSEKRVFAWSTTWNLDWQEQTSMLVND